MLFGNKILTVCLGNICRSPAAEGLIAAHFHKNNINGEVASAGIHAMVDWPADPFSQKVMQEFYQIDISAHRAKQIDERMARYYDLILVMDDAQVKATQSLYPFASGKVHRIGKWRETNVPDPYRQSEKIFQDRIKLINDCVNDWVEKFW